MARSSRCQRRTFIQRNARRVQIASYAPLHSPRWKAVGREFRMCKRHKKRAPGWKRKRLRHRICLQSDSLGRTRKPRRLPRPTPPTPGRIVSPAVSAATAIPIGTPAPLPSNPPLPPPAARPVVTPAVSPKQSRPGARPQPSAKAVRSAQPARPSAAETIVSPKEMKQEESRQEQVQHRPNASRKCCNAAAKNRRNPTLRRLPRPHLSSPPQTPLLPFQKRRVPPRPTRRHPIKDQTGKTRGMNEKPRPVPDPTLPSPPGQTNPDDINPAHVFACSGAPRHEEPRNA